MSKKRYIHALSFKWLTPLYDPILKWVMREETFKRKLIAQSNIQPGMKVLDLGCGTGTLTAMLKRSHPRADVTGLDGDPEVLNIAREKSQDIDIQWDEGLVSSLPYPDSTFDRVITSLVMHHLVTEDKRRAFTEACRVLGPGGELHLIDFGEPHSSVMRLMTKLMHGFEETGDNFAGRLPLFVTEAGFRSVEETQHFTNIFGPLSMLRAVKGA